jgi:asparagine synthase (glutamine-hydrolysing)
MVTSMEHERFYTSGTYFASEMGVYAGWVAHEDSFAAGQAFVNEQRDIALVFAGECFVDPKARADLKQKGHRFESGNGDWLVHLYEEEGDRFFEKLNGLFSGLLINKRTEDAFLFNDRYGVERIYWHETDGELYFASEAKALLRIRPELREFDAEGVAQFLALGCTLETRTLFRNINILPGGSLWSFQRGNCHKRGYFSPDVWESQPTLSDDSFGRKLQETFKRILPRYFESESRIGIALTAGLDTRMIMACLPKTAEKPVCYTFDGERGRTLDARLGARVAEVCGLEHHILRVGGDFFTDFARYADQTVYATDGCLGVMGVHEIYLNGRARELAPVRLTGNYGSEVLRGVSTFKPLALSPGLVDPELRRSLDSYTGGLNRQKEHPITFAAFREIPWKRFGVLAAGCSQLRFRSPYLDNEIVALAYQAPDNIRTPALHTVRLIKNGSPVLSQIPTDMGKLGNGNRVAGALRRTFSKATFKLDYLYNDGLPHWLTPLDPLFRRLSYGTGVLGRHKFLHYRTWFQRELAGYVEGVLTDPRVGRSAFWNQSFLEGMAEDHARGRKNYVMEINAVLTLEAVERLFFRSS